MIHSSLNLYISDDSYTIAPDHHQAPLVISRSSGQLTLGSPGEPKPNDKVIIGLAGILGVISLVKSDYLILIKSSARVADVLKTPVYTPTEFCVYPISRESNISLLENSEERFLLSILKSHLDEANGTIFYTYGDCHPASSLPWDPTTRLQAQVNLSPQSDVPLWKRADDRFFWNKFLMTPLIKLAEQPGFQPVNKYILPVMFGFLQFKLASVNGFKFHFGLISRRSRFRAGARYFSRGIDSNGNVSNYNETEMIIYSLSASSQSNQGRPFKLFRASFVQTRGSVPIFWSQINNLRYVPDLKIMNLPQTQEAIKAHFDRQIQIYGDQYLVNLVNSSGYEKAVKDAYENAVRALGNPRVHYIYFDFHQECKGLRFERVQKLIDRLEDDLIDQGYFYAEEKDSEKKETEVKVVKEQNSVVRTNCMDCLDRTNVVQSALARWVLTLQLREVGILEQNESLDLHPEFIHLFRNMWADNADGVSKVYSGTGALKTDFTRCGSRTKQGALLDLWFSLARYFKNNFLDGSKQDSFDLITGNWTPKSNGSTNHQKSHHFQEHEKVVNRSDLGFEQKKLCRNSPVHQIVLFLFLMFLFAFISATFSQRRSLKLSLASLVLLILSFGYILIHGRDFVNQPRLNSIEFNLSYDGPGFQSSKRGSGLNIPFFKKKLSQRKIH